jgi:hypothetical protein
VMSSGWSPRCSLRLAANTSPSWASRSVLIETPASLLDPAFAGRPACTFNCRRRSGYCSTWSRRRSPAARRRRSGGCCGQAAQVHPSVRMAKTSWTDARISHWFSLVPAQYSQSSGSCMRSGLQSSRTGVLCLP